MGLVDGPLRLASDGLSDLLKGLATDSDTTVLLRGPDGWMASGRQIDPAALPQALPSSAEGGAPVRQRLVVERVPVLAVAWSVGGTDLYVQLFPLTQLDRAFRFLSSL